MNAIVDWLRSLGHFVLPLEADHYQHGEDVVRASELLGRANRLRAERSMELFARSALMGPHANRRRHRGNLQLLMH